MRAHSCWCQQACNLSVPSSSECIRCKENATVSSPSCFCALRGCPVGAHVKGYSTWIHPIPSGSSTSVRGQDAVAGQGLFCRRHHSLLAHLLGLSLSLPVVVSRAGYCQISCSRCSCCPTLLQTALQAGLTEFAWAMNRSTTNVEALTQPGLIATVMAPDDNAMRTLFNKIGERVAP